LLLHLTTTSPLALSTPQQQTELESWVSLFSSVTGDGSSVTDNVLSYLESHLLSHTFLLSYHLTAADLVMLVAMQETVRGWQVEQRTRWPSIMRWIDHVQQHQTVIPRIPLTPPESLLFTMDLNPLPAAAVKPAASAAAKKEEKGDASSAIAASSSSLVSSVISAVSSAISTVVPSSADSKTAPSTAAANGGKAGKAAAASTAAAAAETPQISRLDLRVATVVSCVAHPSESRLAVLTVDVGEASPRTVVSGIAEWADLTSLVGQCLLCMCNLKSGDIKGVDSNGRILVATDSKDEKKKELCIVTAAQIRGGEKVHVVKGAQPDAVLAPKNLHRILKGLRTDSDGYVRYEELFIETSAGKVQTGIKDGIVA
jgi:aminoacyl tRNA synthase complex-interacting multifunctional protein 1